MRRDILTGSFYDPEIAKMVQFLDPEIVEKVDKSIMLLLSIRCQVQDFKYWISSIIYQESDIEYQISNIGYQVLVQSNEI